MQLTLPIIIPGKGRIPRLGSIGPKLIPTDVNLDTLEAIIRAPRTPGASYRSPINGEIIPLNFGNYKVIFDKYARDRMAVSAEKPAEIKLDPPKAPIQLGAHVPDLPPDQRGNQSSVDDEKNNIQPVIEPVPEAVTETITEPVVPTTICQPVDDPTPAVPDDIVSEPAKEAVTEAPIEVSDNTNGDDKTIDDSVSSAVPKAEAPKGEFKRFTKPDDNRGGQNRSRH